VACLALPYFLNIISQMARLLEKVTEDKMSALILSTTFA
jgi:hypothetical protein